MGMFNTVLDELKNIRKPGATEYGFEFNKINNIMNTPLLGAVAGAGVGAMLSGDGNGYRDAALGFAGGLGFNGAMKSSNLMAATGALIAVGLGSAAYNSKSPEDFANKASLYTGVLGAGVSLPIFAKQMHNFTSNRGLSAMEKIKQIGRESIGAEGSMMRYKSTTGFHNTDMPEFYENKHFDDRILRSTMNNDFETAEKYRKQKKYYTGRD